MSGGGGSSVVNETPRISALRIQTSCYGTTVAVILGRQRCTGNMLYYGDLTAIRHEQTESSGGGKGGGEFTTTTITYTYRYSIQIGICEGPATVGEIWMFNGNDKLKLSVNQQYGYTIYPGETPNTFSAVLASRHPDQFFNYPGLCNFTAVDMGEFSGDSPPSFSFEVTGYDYDALIGGADPANSIRTIITNQRWGAAAPENYFPTATEYGDYAVAMGWSIGLELAEQKPAAEWIQDVLDQTNSQAVWAADHLEIIPYGDTAVSGNGRYWTPSVAPIYDLTDDDFIGDPEEPIRVHRKSDTETYNIQPVEFRNAANEYNIETIDGSDPASVLMFGPKKNKTTFRAHGLQNPSVAARLGECVVQRTIRTRNGYEFTLPWRYCRLLPMDIVTLTDSQLGMHRYPVRITRVVETAEMEIQCTAEDFPAGAGHASLVPRQDGTGYNRDYNAAPGNSATPVIFEPPIALSGIPEIWLGTAGGSNWGGADIWLSLDGVSYRNVGRTPGRARIGVTTNDFPLVTDPDSTSVLGVNLTISQSSLIGCSAVDRDAFVTLSWVGGELIAYQNATLTGPNAYDLSSLRRGGYGSPVTTHLAGASFMRLDDAVFRYDYDPDLIGATIYIKLQSRNLFGGAAQDIDTLVAHPYVIQGAPLGAVSSLALSQPWVGPDCSIRWAASKSASSYLVEVWAGGFLRRSVPNVTATNYVYSFDDNRSDGGPWRNIEFRLYAVSPNGESTTASILSASNQQVGAPTGIDVSGSGPTLYVSSTQPFDVDYAGTIVWASQITGFDPLITDPISHGPAWSIETATITPGKYYVRIAHFDVFGEDALNISSEISVDYLGAAGGIAQVPDASAITTFPGDAFWAVFDQATGKIWRWDAEAGHYTSAVSASDINGVVAAEVADASITDVKLAANSVTASKIVAGAVTTSALAASAVTADKVQANSLTADKMAVSDLSAISANLGSITSAALDLYSGSGGGWGYARSYSKWWNDGNNGWISARDSTGATFFEVKSGSSRIWSSSWGDCGINFNDKFSVDSSGNIVIKSANAGARLEVKNNVIKVYDENNILRVKLGDLSA